MASSAEVVAPLATLLPDPPTGEHFTDAQWRVLLSIMDAIIPSIRKETATQTDDVSRAAISETEYQTAVDHLKKNVVNPPDNVALDEYFDERPSDNAEFQDLLRRTLVHYAREDARKAIAFILSALDTRVGSFIITGYSTPIYEQPIKVREEILRSWRVSSLAPLNGLHKSLTALGKNLWIKTSPSFSRVSGFSKVPENYEPAPSFEFDFRQFEAGSEPEVIETDVVIVGSGCGGAVCAKNLAEAGHRVLVVDKGYSYKTTQLPMTEAAAGIHLFDNGGAIVTDDSSVTIIAANAWGGGGTVNWSASLQTQGFVRKEWAEDRGLTFFGTAEFQASLDRVCNRMGVSADHIRHNHGNQVILEGARKLGYTAKAVPQNTGGHEHYCGHCTLGCESGQKQGPVATWLPDAARAGAEFIEGFEVKHVIFDELKGTKKAVGVKGVWTSRNRNGGRDGPLSERTVREVVVKAKKVIISCGTLWSPIVLLNSGLKNWQIGRNLYLHPVNLVSGVFKEDVRPWEGGILTSVCTTFENLDGHGHGTKLEATCMMPSWCLSFMNWNSGLDFKLQALKYRHTNSFISIVRDRDTGRVYPDPTSGVPRIQYTPSAFDRAHAMEGVIALAKMCYIQGAEEIHVGIGGIKPFIRNPQTASSPDSTPTTTEDARDDPGVTDPRLTAWLAEIRQIGNKPPTGTFACAHQMGSNRMSVQEKDGVVDPKGRVWGTEGLYVSDASIFPSASGVNPMITNMAISDWISRGVSRELRSAATGVEARL